MAACSSQSEGTYAVKKPLKEWMKDTNSTERELLQIPWMKHLIGEVENSPPQIEVRFFGQESLKEQVTPFLTATRFPHTLIYGEPGIGKTAFAKWVAWSRQEPFEDFLAPVKPEQLPHMGLALLDEAHRQRNPEWLFPVMEKGSITLMAATTKPEALDAAFRDRFFLRLHINRYGVGAMKEIVLHMTDQQITEPNLTTLATASAGNPRQAERMVKTGIGLGTFDAKLVLTACHITADGLTELHVRYLRQLHQLNRPTGVATLSTLLYTDDQTIKEAERLLLDHDLVSLTNTGRELTGKGKRYVERLNE
jgi:Holliday junction resolvasome RuvABC ATP-dependent DNA helicase subunit